jgi:ATP-dependent protease Clp ATPase subunit
VLHSGVATYAPKADIDECDCHVCFVPISDIIREENKSSLVKSRDGIPTPKEIRKVLDDYVIGQDDPRVAQRLLDALGI